MFTYALKFFIGTIILTFSTQIFIKLAKKLSKILRISPLIIGLTVVSLGTTFPELAVSTIAAINKDLGFATGNIIGSNIINIFLVLAVGVLIGNLRIGTAKTQRNGMLLLLMTLLFIFFQKVRISSLLSGSILIFSALIFIALEYKWGIFGRTHEDKAYIESSKHLRFHFKTLLILVLSIFGISLGGLLLVSSVEGLSVITGYSTTVFGLTLTAITTSLPELFSIITSQRDNEGKIAIGNILGSNLYNLLFIGGIISIIASSALNVSSPELLMLLFATVCFVAIIKVYNGKVVPKWVGILLLGMFVAYIYILSLK